MEQFQQILTILLVLAIAVDFLLIGLRGLTTGKPIFIGIRRLFFGFLLLTALSVGVSIARLVSVGEVEAGDGRIIRHVIVFSFTAWQWFLGGYLALGITEETLGRAIGFALTRLGLRSENRANGIALLESDSLFEARIVRKSYAFLRVRGGLNPQPLLEDIVHMLREYYETFQERTAKWVFVVFMLGGIIIGLLGHGLAQL